MPRIDPGQLLRCLSVLLSPNGGIKSREEVQRLASLMTKFSKKLVSKCVYIQILKYTDPELLGMFMGSGGWILVHMWLTEGIVGKNWALVKEILGLLLLCPADIERLRSNNCPKLVKELSKEDNNFAIRALASKLVEQWLKIVKSEEVAPLTREMIDTIVNNSIQSNMINSNNGFKKSSLMVEEVVSPPLPEHMEIKINGETHCEKASDEEKRQDADHKAESEKDIESLPVLKISMKDGKQIISQVDKDKYENNHTEKTIKDKSSKHKSSSEKTSSSDSKSKSNSNKHSSKSHSSDSNDKHRSSHRSSSPSRRSSKEKLKHSSDSSKSKSSESKSNKSSSSSDSNSSSGNKSKSHKHKDKSREKDEKVSKDHNEKNSHNEKIGKDHNEKNSKDHNEKIGKDHNEKNHELGKPSIHKLGKIPKLTDAKKDKPSISIEVRKPEDPKPKTVKTFHSKFRKHGLEEEIKPPPSRASLLTKKPSVAPPPPPIAIPKRRSPERHDSPPEKKPKTMETVEKPGAIKLIPAKPKPMMLLESDMFMDALTASATNKKEPKKRKRRTSGSKDGNPASDSSPPHTPTTTSPSHESKSVPLKFYQDTLDNEEDKTKLKTSPKTEEKADSKSPPHATVKEAEEKMEVSEPVTLTVNGLKGVLCYHKKKGPKKSIKWKTNLEDIQYFELDETERVNVTKTFTDMKYLERINEREAVEKARNLINDDVMEEKTTWRHLLPIDCPTATMVEYGKLSKEKDIQAIRQKGTLQPLYFHKSMIPDSPLEADIETHTYTEPCIIPLGDVTGNQDTVSDFRTMPWPEPKGNAPVATNNVNIPPMFPPPISQFPNNYQTPFPGPNMGPVEWQMNVPPHMMGPPMGPGPGPIIPGAMPPGGMPAPGMMMPPDNVMMGPDMFNGPNPMFPVPPEMYMEHMNMGPNMFPPDFSKPPGIMPGPDSQNFRGGLRGRGVGGPMRGKVWEGPPRGRGAHVRGGGTRKALCIHFQRKGSCRLGDNCGFLHPGVNCPF